MAEQRHPRTRLFLSTLDLERAVRREVDDQFPVSYLLFDRKDFDPDQPRDDSGKWTSNGGGGGGAAVASPLPPSPPATQQQVKDALAKYGQEKQPWNLTAAGFVTKDGTLYDIGTSVHDDVARRVLRDDLEEPSTGRVANYEIGEKHGVVRVWKIPGQGVGVESHQAITADQMDTIQAIDPGGRGGVTWDHYGPDGERLASRHFVSTEAMASQGYKRGYVKKTTGFEGKGNAERARNAAKGAEALVRRNARRYERLGLKEFDPDQPRDERGRWAATSAPVASAAEAPATFAAVNPLGMGTREMSNAIAADREEAADRALNDPNQSRQQYKARIAGELSERLQGNPAWQQYMEKLAAAPGSGYYQQASEAAASALVQQWAESSGDHHVQSVALQTAIKDEFGLNDASMAHMQDRPLVNQAVDNVYAENGAAYRAFVRAMYDNTQEDLAAKGITEMTVYRGMTFPPESNIQPHPTEPDPVTGMVFNGKPHTTTTSQQPASSWSYSFEKAGWFAPSGNETGAMIAATVPAERILSTINSGFGAKPENEVVVLGGEDEVTAWAWYAGDRDANPPYSAGELIRTKLAVWRALEIKEWDPNQPRDEGGRWTSDGGGAPPTAVAASRALVGDQKDVKVTRVPGVDDKLKRDYGRALSDQELAKLAMVPNGGSVKATKDWRGNVNLRGDQEAIGLTTSVVLQGKDTVYTSGIFMPKGASGPTGHGIGARLVNQQVETARSIGIKNIDLDAVGSGKNLRDNPDTAANGFYTWPRLGFDSKAEIDLAPIARAGGVSMDDLPPGGQGTVQDLMAVPGGRQAWKEHGDAQTMRFETDPASTSSRILDKYMVELSTRKVLQVAWDVKFDPNQPRDEQGRWVSDDGVMDYFSRPAADSPLSESQQAVLAANVRASVIKDPETGRVFFRPNVERRAKEEGITPEEFMRKFDPKPPPSSDSYAVGGGWVEPGSLAEYALVGMGMMDKIPEGRLAEIREEQAAGTFGGKYRPSDKMLVLDGHAVWIEGNDLTTTKLLLIDDDGVWSFKALDADQHQGESPMALPSEAEEAAWDALVADGTLLRIREQVRAQKKRREQWEWMRKTDAILGFETKEWDESQVTRDEAGRFSSSGGGTAEAPLPPPPSRGQTSREWMGDRDSIEVRQDDQAREALRLAFGRELSNREIARLAMATNRPHEPTPERPDRTQPYVLVEDRFSYIRLSTQFNNGSFSSVHLEKPDKEWVQTIPPQGERGTPQYIPAQGEFVQPPGVGNLHTEIVTISPSAPKGTGTLLTQDQLESAQALGIKTATLDAIGEPGGRYNGYYTWPRLGYDSRPLGKADVSAKVKPFIPPRQKVTVQEIISTPEGREAWKAGGKELQNMSFDLTPGSRNWGVLNEYVTESGLRSDAKTTGRKVADADKDEIEHPASGADGWEFDEDEEAAFDRVMARLRERGEFKEFDPNQPRDESGRWTTGAPTAGAGEVPPGWSALLPSSGDERATSALVARAREDKADRALNDPSKSREEYKARIANEISDRLQGNSAWEKYVAEARPAPTEAEAGPWAGVFGRTQEQAAGDSVTAASNLVHGWAITSGDHSPQAIAMQAAIKDEFNLRDVTEDHLRPNEVINGKATDDYAKNGDAYRAFARAMYDNTQDDLKAKGITDMTVYRGMSFANAEDAERIGLKLDGQPQKVEVTQQPASSWAYSFETAKMFTGPNGVVMAATVPAERILSTMNSGFGAKPEQEVVLLGGEDEVAAQGWQKTGTVGFGPPRGGPPADAGALFNLKTIWRGLETKAFDPDQPRDETGKWTSNGGGGSGGQPSSPTSGGGATLASLGVKPTEEYRERAIKGTDDELARASMKYGKSRAEVAERIEENMRQMLDGAQVKMGLPYQAFEKIFQPDGSFKNQHETRTSLSGSYVPEIRSRAEQEAFGVSEDAPSQSYPKYGYVDNAKVPNEEMRTLYGDVTVTFKDSVKDRTTVTFGDSLAGLSQALVIPQSINDPPNWRSTSYASYADGDRSLRQIMNDIVYVEAQIHTDPDNPLTWRDVESVSFEPSPRVGAADMARYRQMAEERGIEVKTHLGFKEWDPNQPRDEGGRWTSNGGGGGAESSAAPAPLPSPPANASLAYTRGGKVAWPTSKEELDALTISPSGGSGWGKLVTKDGTPITDDTPLIVYHATTRETAEFLMKEGVDPANKPSNLARERFEAGEYAEFAPGRGVSSGFYVAGTPHDASGYGPVTIGIRILAGDLSTTPEQESLGSERVPAVPIEGLRVGDALIAHKISPEDMTIVHDSRQTYATQESVAARLAQDHPKTRQFKEWDESQVTRDEAGRFAEGGGGGAGVAEAPQPLPSPSAPTSTSNRVEIQPEQRQEIANRVKAITGRDLTDEQLGALTGAPAGATTRVIPQDEREGKNVAIITEHPDIEDQAVAILRGPYQSPRDREEGNPGSPATLHYEQIYLKSEARGSGQGVAMVARSVAAAHEAGVTRVDLKAEGYGPKGYLPRPGATENGYYTWARIGFDAELEASDKRGMEPPGPGRVFGETVPWPAEFQGAERVSDLMRTPEGAAFWKEWGSTMNMTMDTTPGSTGRQVMDAYLEARGITP
jgi:GNAT superfamily N-acetyltransferase